MTAALRIFSYLPNPRIFKATVAARLTGVELEIRGAAGTELPAWLWDFDAKPLDASGQAQYAHAIRASRAGFTTPLFKTDAFLAAHPFGTVPAAFSPDGAVGISESNSIMRAVARLGRRRRDLYGADAYLESRVDGFLDATLLFGRDVQVYILGLRAGQVSAESHRAMSSAFHAFFTALQSALTGTKAYLAGPELTLADISFMGEMGLLFTEARHLALLEQHGLEAIAGRSAREVFPEVFAHVDSLVGHEAFAPDFGPYLRALEPAA